MPILHYNSHDRTIIQIEDKDLKDFLKGMYDKPHIMKRIVFCVISVCIMGFCVSWFDSLGWGTDPCSVMNIAIAKKLGLLLGTWQALFNVLLFVIVIWKDKTQIGFGTVFNMFLVGYAYDVTNWARDKWIPDMVFPKIIWTKDGFDAGDFAVNMVAMLVILAIFVFFVGVYMSVELGTAPYDAIPFIIADSQEKLSFRTVRIIWDVSVTVIGFLAGGVVGVVTVIMAFTIGPVAAFVEKRIKKFIS